MASSAETATEDDIKRPTTACKKTTTFILILDNEIMIRLSVGGCSGRKREKKDEITRHGWESVWAFLHNITGEELFIDFVSFHEEPFDPFSPAGTLQRHMNGWMNEWMNERNELTFE
jgi:hypothetical protein